MTDGELGDLEELRAAGNELTGVLREMRENALAVEKTSVPAAAEFGARLLAAEERWRRADSHVYAASVVEHMRRAERAGS